MAGWSGWDGASVDLLLHLSCKALPCTTTAAAARSSTALPVSTSLPPCEPRATHFHIGAARKMVSIFPKTIFSYLQPGAQEENASACSRALSKIDSRTTRKRLQFRSRRHDSRSSTPSVVSDEDIDEVRRSPNMSMTRYTTRGPASSPPTVAIDPLVAQQNRVQFRNMFTDFFFPRGESHLALILDPNTLARSSDSALNAAEDALSVLLCGASLHSRKMVIGAYSLYIKALNCLRLEVERVNAFPSVPINNTLKAMYFLTMCEKAMGDAYDDSGWLQHARGVIKTHETHVVNPEGDSPVTNVFLFGHCKYLFYQGYGLLARQEVNCDPPMWDNSVGRVETPLTTLALQLCGLLQRYDVISDKFAACVETGQPSGVTIYAMAEQLYHQCLEHRRKLHECMRKWSATIKASTYTVVGVDNYPEFTTAVGTHRYLFPDAYHFFNMPAGMMYRVYFTSLVVLDETIIDAKNLSMRSYEGGLDDVNALRQLHEVEQDLATAATDLARTLPYFSQPYFNSAGPLSMLEPLHFLEQYFLSMGEEYHKEQAWCRSVKKHLTLGGKVVSIMSSTE